MAAHREVLPSAQLLLWPELAEVSGQFVLYGGTAIALHLGHRSSVDFDFFSSSLLNGDAMLRSTRFLQDCEVLQLAPNSLTVSVLRGAPVKISFFGDISFGRTGTPEMTDDGCVMVASQLDLLATKLKVLLQRIEIKDYLDIEALLNAGLGLDEGLGAARTLYGSAFPPAECVKALTYFDEGDARDLPETTRSSLRSAVADWKGDVAKIERLSEGLL